MRSPVACVSHEHVRTVTARQQVRATAIDPEFDTPSVGQDQLFLQHMAYRTITGLR